MDMNKKELKEILKLSKERLSKKNLVKYYNLNDDINALIYGIAEYRRNKGLHCTWEDAVNIIGEIFNKEPHIGDYSAIEIEKEISRLIPKNFYLDSLLTLNKVMSNE